MLHPHPGTVGRAVQGPRRCPAPVFILHQIRKPRTCHRAAGVDDQLVTAASQPTEVDGNQEQQQTQQAYTSDSQPDLTATFSDLSVDEPAGFPDLGVDPLLVSSLSAAGIATPSPIQEVAIPQLLQGHNAAVQSYTGSGKTLAYLLPAMTLALRRAEAAFRCQRAAAAQGRQLSEEDMYSVQVLVVAPNQELAMQICRVAADLLPKEGRGAVQQAIGGANMRRQAEAIAENQPLVVVGTPGRLADLVRMGALRLHRCPLLILDEADQLLGDVYSTDMRHIVEHCGKRLTGSTTNSSTKQQTQSSSSSSGSSSSQDTLLKPTQRQTVLVSATLWDGVLSRFNVWCPSPLFLTTGGSPTWAPDENDNQGSTDDPAAAAKTWGWGAKGWEGPASVVQQGPKTQGMAGGAEGSGLVPALPPNLEHMYLVVNPQHKPDAVRRAMYALNVGTGLGFMNWQQRLKDVAAKVAAKKIEVGLLHGELAASERAAVLDAARKGAFQLLLVSDVAARGIDLPQIDVVFNIELPSNAAHYAHRAGRTGRMGAPGLVVTLVAPGERFVVERLSRKLGVPILECHLAHGELVVGPPPKKDTKKKQKQTAEQQQQQVEAEQQQQQLSDRRQSNSKASSSSSSSKQQQQPGDSRTTSPTAAGVQDDDVIESSDADSDDYVVDEDDDVAVEGDELYEVYKARLRRELEQELEELRQEKQVARQQRYRQKQAAARGDVDPADTESSRKPRVRRPIGAKPPKGSPEEAAAMAMAAIAADEKARRAKSKLPAALLEGTGGEAAAAAVRGGARRKPAGGRKQAGTLAGAQRARRVARGQKEE